MRVLWFASIGLTACTVGDPPLEAPADHPLPAELRAGDLVVAGDLSLVVPEPGETVGISAHEDDGTTFELTITNPLDGAVAIVAPPLAIETFAIASGPCADGAYHLEGFHWDRDLKWMFEASSTPAANSAGRVATGLQVAANAITGSRNSCGLADTVSATNSYGGTTTRSPNIPSSTTKISCGSRDQVNVIGFGVLPATYLAVTCYWTSNNVALEADIKFNSNHAWFAQDVPAGCSNAFGIEQVGAHELGHAFGLGHVGQASHPALTMSPASGPCTNTKLSLGLGDVKGLRALY